MKKKNIKSNIINYSWLFLKILIFLFIIYIISQFIKIDKLTKDFLIVDILVSIITACLIILFQIFTFAFRFYQCSKILSLNFKFINALKSTFLGGITSHTPLSFFGGDMARLLYCVNNDVNFSNSVKLIYFDRFFGFLALFFITFLLLPYTLNGVIYINVVYYYVFFSISCILGFLAFCYLETIFKLILPNKLTHFKIINFPAKIC